MPGSASSSSFRVSLGMTSVSHHSMSQLKPCLKPVGLENELQAALPAIHRPGNHGRWVKQVKIKLATRLAYSQVKPQRLFRNINIICHQHWLRGNYILTIRNYLNMGATFLLSEHRLKKHWVVTFERQKHPKSVLGFLFPGVAVNPKLTSQSVGISTGVQKGQWPLILARDPLVSLISHDFPWNHMTAEKLIDH